MQIFEMFSGDSKYLVITITEKIDNSFVQLEGATVVWNMSDISKSIDNGIEITGDGEITVHLVPQDTETKSGLHRHHVVITDMYGNVSTVLKGEVHINSRK